VSVDYFHTLGIPLLAGREFTDADTKGSPKVAVVNEAFARKFNLGDRVIGKHMALGAGTNKALDIEIVGLARDAKYDEVSRPAAAAIRDALPAGGHGCAHLLREGGLSNTRGDLGRSRRSCGGSTPIFPSAIFGRWRIRFGTTRAAIER
jgi:hypothetical protein